MSLAAGYALSGLDRGWVPHDEGQIGQTAERVLSGQLPHRDFDEMYTGGLTLLHAAALSVLGDTLMSPRYLLFAVFVAWLPAVFYLASRMGSPLMAAAVTLTAAAWSIPNYSASLPSWYNLFLAVFGVAATLRYLETQRRRWLFVAGLAGGLSCLVKVAGVYYVAGVAFFLLMLEQERRHDEGTGSGHRYTAYSIVVSLAALGVTGGVAAMFVRSGPDAVMFLLPPAMVASLLVWRELARRRDDTRSRFTSALALLSPFAAGVAAPVAVFLVPYLTGGGLGDLAYEVFILPGRRVAQASWALPATPAVLVAPMLVVLGFVAFARRPPGLIPTALLGGGLLGVLAQSASAPVYLLAWRPLPFVAPLAVIAAVMRVARRNRTDDIRAHLVLLLACVTAFSGLIQFPFTAPLYLCYVAPLIIILMTAVVSLPSAGPRVAGGLVLGFYLVFAVIRVTPGFIHAIGYHPAPDELTTPLTLTRAGGLRVFPEQAGVYEELIPLVQSVARGKPLYAFPDAPEVYFLSGAVNPSRTIYDFLSEPVLDDSGTLGRLDRLGIQTVVINRTPQFSAPPSAALLGEIRRRYPEGRRVGAFEVRWLP